VRQLAESGDLPGRRIGGEWRFARAALLAWLAASS
jgi:excisionase family DNA binding protein